MSRNRNLKAGLHKARRVLKRVAPNWRRRAGVVELGVGLKLTGGRATTAPAIHIYVKSKIDESELRRNQVFPKKIEGVLVDVIAVTGRRHNSNGPISSGLHIVADDANSQDYGTLGLVFRRVGDAQNIWFLTCAHVAPMGRNMYVVGDPQEIGKAPRNTNSQINGRLTPLLDWAAIQSAIINPKSIALGIIGANGPYNVGTAKEGDEVFRVTTSNSIVQGRVTALGVPIDLQGGGNPTVGAIQVGPLGTSPFSGPGDSGTMLLRHNGTGTDLVGVIFGEWFDANGNPVASAASAFDRIQPELNVDFEHVNSGD
jgi:hypothetical protein